MLDARGVVQFRSAARIAGVMAGIAALSPAIAQPANDLCADAIVITEGDTAFTTVNAATDGPAACGSLGRDIWYVFTAPCDGTATFETCTAPTFDTVIAAYPAGACPPLAGTLIVCVDDSCGLQTRIQFVAEGGTAYLIRVGGFSGASGTGTLRCAFEARDRFSYQGRLTLNGAPVDQPADLRFRTFRTEKGGSSFGAIHTLSNVPVTGGVFTTDIPIGVATFANEACVWLEISVRVPAGSGFFQLLEPRQRIQYTPYAMRSVKAEFVAWAGVQGVPEGFADGVDNGTGSDHSHSSLAAADGAPAEAVLVDAAGFVGVGTTAPLKRLHVANGSTGGAPHGNADMLIEDNASCYLNIMAPDASERGISFGSPLSAIHGGVYYTNDGGMTLRVNNNQTAIAITALENVGVGVASNDAKLHVQNAGRPIKCDRTGSDGELLAWARDDSVVGLVTVAGGTVSYGAFTGSHWAWMERPARRGELVRMTGSNRMPREEGEPVYGVEPTSQPNDPACLGAYLAPLGSESDGPADAHQVMSVGNGEVWVVDAGSDIVPGDALISSHVAGCAMKDDPVRFAVGHIVARAAQGVQWNAVPVGPDGVRRVRVSVLFDRFTRGSADVQERLDQLVAENAALKARLDRLEKLLGSGSPAAGK